MGWRCDIAPRRDGGACALNPHEACVSFTAFFGLYLQSQSTMPDEAYGIRSTPLQRQAL